MNQDNPEEQQRDLSPRSPDSRMPLAVNASHDQDALVRDPVIERVRVPPQHHVSEVAPKDCARQRVFVDEVDSRIDRVQEAVSRAIRSCGVIVIGFLELGFRRRVEDDLKVAHRLRSSLRTCSQGIPRSG